MSRVAQDALARELADGQAAPARPHPAVRRMEKAAGAFRTISEVADDLEVPQHVLRFWESKFPQIRPMKRGGGRRYYRPEDIDLLRAICSLLYEQGYTIKGVQKLMREGSLRLGGDPGVAAAPAVAAEDAGDPALAAKIGQAEAVQDLPLFRSGLEESQRRILQEALGELVELRDRLRRILTC